MTPVRLEPAAPRSRVKHSTIEPLRSHYDKKKISKRFAFLRSSVGRVLDLGSIRLLV